MKALFLDVAALAAIVLLVIMSGCHKPTEPDDDNYAVVKDNVVDLSKLTNLSEPVINGDTFTYSYTGTAPNINVGDVLVGQTGFGYMRKVTGVQSQNNQIICQTDSARIVDVIKNCSINGNAQLSLGDLGKGTIAMEPTYLAEGVSVTKDGSYHITSATLLDNISFGTLKIKNSTLSYEPDFDFDLDITDGEITNLSVQSTGTFSTTMTIEALNLRNSKPVTDLPPIAQHMSILPYFWIGPVPVFLGVELCPTIKFSVPNQLTQEWTQTSSQSLTLGAHFCPEFSPIMEIDSSSQSSATVLDHILGDDIELKVGFTPRVKMLIGGVLGPKLGPVVYGRVAAGYEDDAYNAWLYCGIDLRISMAIDAFGWQMASVNFTVNCAEYELYHYSVPMATLPAPTFNPPEGSYSSPQNITIACSIDGTTIRYTTNGSEPSSTSTLYTVPVNVSSTTTIKAKAFMTGTLNSPTASATYTINPPPNTVATPIFSPPGGTYASPQLVSLSCTTSGSTIRYTTDGSDPSESSSQYVTPISVSSTTTINAKAYKSGWTPSEVATAHYNISSNDYQSCDFPTILLGEWYQDSNNVWNFSIRNIPPYRIRTGNIYYWPQTTHFNGNRYRILAFRDGTSEEKHTFFFENVTATTMDANRTLGEVWEPVGGFSGHHKN